MNSDQQTHWPIYEYMYFWPVPQIRNSSTAIEMYLDFPDTYKSPECSKSLEYDQ